MNLNFFKYHGAGNDFILIDNRGKARHFSNREIQKLCSRHFGIGSDGLILIQDHPFHDFKMIFYNPDASQSFCGNGSRCAVQFAFDQKIISNNFTTFESTNGIYRAEILSSGEIDIQLQTCDNYEVSKQFIYLNTGSPHVIIETNNAHEIPIVSEAHKIRYNKPFEAEGVNVNFVETINHKTILMRTYERGVENETLSCGTGVTAAALSRSLISNQKGSHTINVETKGGKFTVRYFFDGKSFTKIHLIGPAEWVYRGTVSI